jgi:adenylyltransferase/sulfurtransferase
MKKYARQMLLPGIGEEGQKKLRASCVAVVGVGAIGSLAADYLARAGVGRLILIDKDKVEEVNIHRQLLYSRDDLGKSKVIVAKEELLGANNDVAVEVYEEFISERNAEKFLSGADLILDCTDKMSARKTLSDYCGKKNKTWIHAAASGAKCNVLVVDGNSGYSRYFDSELFEDCSQNAIIGPAAGLAACVQATEAIKFLVGEKPCGELQRFDLWKNRNEMIKIKRK